MKRDYVRLALVLALGLIACRLPCQGADTAEKKAWLEKLAGSDGGKISADIEAAWGGLLKSVETDPEAHFLRDGTHPSAGNLREALKKKLPKIQETLIRSYQTRIDAGNAWDVKVWLDSPAPRKLWTLLGQAQKPELDEERQAWIKANYAGFTEERLAILKRVRETWRHGERKTAQEVYFFVAKISGRERERPSFVVEGFEPQVQKEWEETLRLRQMGFDKLLWYAWRDIPDQDARSFLSFLEAGPGKVWEAAFHATYLEGMELGAIAWWELFQ